jgi:hypothetical protein
MSILIESYRFWTLGPNWPKGGEIDILEGVNDYTNNGMTLHTGPGCHIGSDTTQFSGSVTTENCDVNAKDQLKNAGCSIKHPSTQSYGLNQNGGGVYATQWNSDAISVYFFPRGSVPADVLSDNPNPSTWGKPAAKFAGACDIDKMFAEQKIIIDTTFCGQWAGGAWKDGSCAEKANTCEEYVRDNPEAFTEAYWEINALKVYQDDGNAPVAPSASITPPKSTALPVPAPPAATVNSTYPPIVPSTSSQAILPISSSNPISAAPSKSTLASVVPLPSGDPAVPDVPAPSPPSSRTGGGLGPVRPSKTVDNQISAPTGANGLPGWRWPVAGDNQPGNEPGATTTAVPTPKASVSTPSQNTMSAPTPQQNVAQPSQAPTVSAQPDDVPLATPIVPAAPDARPVHTVYETVYLTVPGEAAATPAPDVKKARMARHVREHRRRWTQHNARL